MSFVFGTSGKMRDLERQVRSIARSGLPVLIEGESGSGKEALAAYLHTLSGSSGDLLRYFCRPTAPERAAAALSRACRAPGTLFLKHVNLLPMELQEQFLADLEHQNGKNRVARLMASAPEPLEGLVFAKQFLPGVYYRLSAYRVHLPPLRERSTDIPELFSVICSRLAAGFGDRTAKPSARLLEGLMAYSWPGNVRELENVARMYVLASDGEGVLREIGQTPQAAAVPENGEAGSLKEQVRRAVQKLESEIILKTLERHRWNRRRAAQSLQISYRSLLYKMKNCEIRLSAEMRPERMNGGV